MLNTFGVIKGFSDSYSSFFKKNSCIFFQHSTLFYFKKYNFKIIGKIFRWYFFKKKIRMSLNHGHTNVFFFKNLRLLKIYKAKYDNDIIFLNPLSSSRFFFFLEKPRKVNIFTKRGFFVNRTYSKKLGKISAYL